MKYLLILLLTLHTFVLSHNPKSKYDSIWKKFKNQHRKKYLNQSIELKRRLEFDKNLNWIEEHEKAVKNGLRTFKLALNEFADLSDDEFLKFTGLRASLNTPIFSNNIISTTTNKITSSSTQNILKTTTKDSIPESVDWRENGCVSYVKAQNTCGACWAFAAIAALETAYCKKTGNLEILSEQQLIDCSTSNKGCVGGWMPWAYDHAIKFGVMSSNIYPYRNGKLSCQYDSTKIVVNVTRYQTVIKNDEYELTKAVALYGPVSVSIDGSTKDFRFYESGIFYSNSCKSSFDDLNHAVTVIGYGTNQTTGEDYYIIKNSWGQKWGLKGYMYIARNRNNTCGIATAATYPIL